MLKTWIRFEVSGEWESSVYLVFVAYDKSFNLLSTGSAWIHGGETRTCAELVKAHRDAGIHVEVVYYGGIERKYDYLNTQTDGA